MKKNIFLLVDGNAIVHRAFHALPTTLTDKKGRPTNAVFGFARILIASIKQFAPTNIAIAFDVAGPTFRDELFAQYKATRVKAPQELYDQIPVVHKMLDALSIPHFGITGVEADDIIGTLAHHIVKNVKNGEVIILTGDGDTLQLVSGQVKVAMPQRGVQPPQVYARVTVEGKIGLPPENIVDYKALAGDSSDNIPGVKGVGPKTAVSLIKRYRTLKGVYQNIETVTPDTLKSKLIAGKENAFLSQKLATIKKDVKLNFKLGDTKVGDYSYEEAEQFFSKLNMRSIINILPKSARQNGDQVALF
ncbi:MAG TPA: 5'-3' exonuclease H3TH domain-containing protein [bacterium]|nr:5'-3' exonuclease H3TH domain-containing protein [bacterium]HOR57448.1 5'-3' exonuclease H3TH domain-containing protein [bacterium]HPL56413.1 5'-3' exonuclease H3TH domain-containing protein [bacterium]